MGTAKKKPTIAKRTARAPKKRTVQGNEVSMQPTDTSSKLHPILQLLNEKREIRRVLAEGGDLATDEATKHIRFVKPEGL